MIGNTIQLGSMCRTGKPSGNRSRAKVRRPNLSKRSVPQELPPDIFFEHTRLEHLMSTPHQANYYPLTEHAIRANVPESSGLYSLALMAGDQTFHNFYSTYSENLVESLLRHFATGVTPTDQGPYVVPPTPYYFSYVPLSRERDDQLHLGKIFAQSSDPVSRLNVINCN